MSRVPFFLSLQYFYSETLSNYCVSLVFCCDETSSIYIRQKKNGIQTQMYFEVGVCEFAICLLYEFVR